MEGLAQKESPEVGVSEQTQFFMGHFILTRCDYRANQEPMSRGQTDNINFCVKLFPHSISLKLEGIVLLWSNEV